MHTPAQGRMQTPGRRPPKTQNPLNIFCCWVFFGFYDREMVLWIDTDRFCQKISRKLNSGTRSVTKPILFLTEIGFLKTCGPEPLRTMAPKGESIRIDPNIFFSVNFPRQIFIFRAHGPFGSHGPKPASCLALECELDDQLIDRLPTPTPSPIGKKPQI